MNKVENLKQINIKQLFQDIFLHLFLWMTIPKLNHKNTQVFLRNTTNIFIHNTMIEV